MFEFIFEKNGIKTEFKIDETILTIKEFEEKLNWFIEKYDDFNDDQKDEITIFVKKFMKNQKSEKIRNTLKGKIFLMIAQPNSSGFSKEISTAELTDINIGFKTTNGGDWNRSNQSFIGKRYNVKRNKNKGAICSIKLEGFNKKTTINNDICPDIQASICKRQCVILATNSEIECDHKDGMKDDWRLNDKKLQKEDDFQPLSKAANDAKRGHCMKCKKTKKRFDAKQLGYSEGFTMGDEDSPVCNGCYWFDPIDFNKQMSKDFKKKY